MTQADRVEIVHRAFLERTATGTFPPGPPPTPGLSPEDARQVFRAQCLARALDRESRAMQRRGEGFYTIGSSGHEGMAAVAHALRPDDIAFLHYRDAAFQIARAAQRPEGDIVEDMLLSFACAADDPISGGRHKVLGSRRLMIPPQTSTIASHLPKAVGAAYGLGLARRNPPEHRMLPEDGIAVVSFGDASINHSTAQGAFNAAGWAAVQGTPLPLLFVCEDNRIGISVRSPKGWVAAVMQSRPGIDYTAADGCDLTATYAAARRVADHVRRHRRPAILHLSLVRLYGHAGADVAESYLSREEIARDEARDPLVHAARLLADMGALTPDEAREIYLEISEEVTARAADIANRPHLEGAPAVMASLVPPPRPSRPTNGPSAEARAAAHAAPPDHETPQPMVRHLTWALADLMAEHPEIVLMGEDIGKKGGVYGVTRGLQARLGPDRVTDTLLDEQAILGLAIGMAQNGFIPIPEIQFLAYLHNAEDQIRGEAATLPFFSNGQFTNPMVVRIAGLGYQKGFGGHFHNDNAIGVLRDIPGLLVACPSSGADAARMLREAVRQAREARRVVIFLEPIALYGERDLEPGDGAWMTPYPPPGERLDWGEVGQTGDGTDLAIVSYGNGLRLARRAAARLGAGVRVIDLRWLVPLPEAGLLRALAPVERVLIVDECRRSGGLAEGLMTLVAEQTGLPAARVTAEDSFIATGPAHAATLPSLDGILDAARTLLERKGGAL